MISIFSFNKTHFEEFLPELWKKLTPHEQCLVKELAFPHLRCERILSFSIVKILISKILDISLEKFSIVRLRAKKPYLYTSLKHSIEFSVSHSGDYLLFAFSQDHPVGIDIEKIHLFSDQMRVVKDHFSNQEQTHLAAAPNLCEYNARFFSAWCKKEAYLKGQGQGLVVGNLSAIDTLNQHIDLWKIQSLHAPSGYCAALSFCTNRLCSRVAISQNAVTPTQLKRAMGRSEAMD